MIREDIILDTFAFMLHPLEVEDVYVKYPYLKKMPKKLAEDALRFCEPFVLSNITGIKSPHNEIEGWFVSCPLTSKQMVTLNEDYVLKKIIKTGRLAEKLGAKILGLGAFTAVVGDAGITVARELNIPVTTGNSYTVATALEGTKKAAEAMDIDFKNAEVLVVGATGSIGRVCARAFAREARFLTIAGRDEKKLEAVGEEILKETGLAVRTTKNFKSALRKADIVITVTSALDSVIDSKDLKPGSVICDVARPRDVSKKVAEERNDVFVIEGGVVDVPGDVDFNFDFGFPPKKAYACMAETMILAIEGRFENFTLGRELTLEQVDEISQLAKKHGFKISGFRSFGREVKPEHIKKVKENARKAVAG